MKQFKLLILLLSLFLFSGAVFAESEYQFDVKKLPNPRTTNGGWVTVIGDYLKQNEIDAINQEISAIEKETSVEIAVVVVPNTGGDEFTAAQAIFDLWKIGKKDKNNGLLLLASIDERRFRTHTGYGMEAIFTDATCLLLQEEYVIPKFKQSLYGEGILNYVKKIHALLSSPDAVKEMQDEVQRIYDVQQKEATAKSRSKSIRNYIIFALIGLIFVFFSFVGLINGVKKTKKKMKKKYDKYSEITTLIEKGMLDGSTGFRIFTFTVGGMLLAIPGAAMKLFPDLVALIIGIIPLAGVLGSIILGAAAGTKAKSVVKSWRSEPRKCPECEGVMAKLSEQEEDKYLKKSQQIEENIKTLDYDVWLCGSCNNKTIESFKAWQHSLYLSCPSCSSITGKKVGSKIITAATYSHSGSKQIDYKCLACSHTFNKIVTIPRLEHSSSSSSGGGSWSSGGGSSFGGGSSGGGGSSSSW
jgi:uncharacterized protein